MQDGDAELNITSKQARRFAYSFYSAVSKYCAEHHDEYVRWVAVQRTHERGKQNVEQKTICPVSSMGNHGGKRVRKKVYTDGCDPSSI